MGYVKPPYYLSAYSLAVKAGFKGTLEEWLESLNGRSVEMRYSDHQVQWRCAVPEGEAEDEWKTLFSSDEVRDQVTAEVLDEAQGYANAAARSAELANDIATSAQGYCAEMYADCQAIKTSAEQAAAAAKASFDATHEHRAWAEEEAENARLHAEQAAAAVAAVPKALPNPHKLTITGAVDAEYDGSGEVKVEIPVGGGGVWTGKKFVAFGTSITWACANHDGGYLATVAERNGFSAYANEGVSGAAMANGTANGNGINSKIRNTDVSGFDLVLIECSTNDFKLNVSLGEVGEMGDTDFDTTTFCGALRDSIEFILTNHPAKSVLLITDTQRNNDGYDVNFTNPAGHKLIDYVDAVVAIAELYGLPVCDWYRNSGFNALTLGIYTKDGLHPNSTGYAVLGNLTAGAVANMYCIFGGNDGDVETTTYSVSNNLTNVTSNNSATQVIGGTAYGATLAAKSGYKISGVTVSMGGVDITASAYSKGVVTIDNVTGNIVITAAAVEITEVWSEDSVTWNGNTADITCSAGYPYKLLCSNGGSMIYSASPLFIAKDNTSTIICKSPAFFAVRGGGSPNYIFTQTQEITGGTELSNGYMSWGIARPSTWYSAANHDVLYWDSDEVAVPAS